MICPFCKEEIADGAIKCKHCASMLNTNANTASASTANSGKDAYATINSLNISNELKDKLRFVHDNIKGTKFGLPDYGLKGAELRKTFNWWAFFFIGFYYLIKGMWKKLLSMIWLAILIGLFIEILSGILLYLFGFGIIGFLKALNIVSWVPLSVIAMQSAYYDLYRKEVLKEDFWW
ncbi:DUF2628 domain-containing protein [Desulfovibrio litoralis]|uniref:Zinc-ribbon domain-containing protein n=1 Tax=Desulfovibrio litoralis DSM 11393 TaxID=1121455 RepID=A0A1M7S062_9BACT|nr:DUF2628 domain-containing protein [Desulfovibrio litoralis]SHN51969.1 Protein of unknown function [Desulfovibrio litoralis DSM 11393]